MKRGTIVFVFIIIIVIIAAPALSKSQKVQETVATFANEDFKPENIYTDLQTLALRMDEEILNGSDSFTFYLKDMNINELDNINHAVNGIYGSGETYQQIGTVGEDYIRVRIKVKRNINYYVLKAYLENEPIPEEEVKAKTLYEKVKSILNSNIRQGMSDYQKELILHDYLVKNCHYSENTEQGAESDIYRSYGALVNGDAVCNGYAEALQLLFNCVGVESQFVVGTADGVDHAWNLVKIGDKWYHLDATWDDPLPDSGDKILHPYFNVSDDVISDNHIWNKDDYPMAYSMDYNYYKYYNKYFTKFDDYKKAAYAEIVQHGNNHYEAVIENYDENDSDMQFIFDGNYRYNTVNWQTFESGSYCVLVMQAE